MRGLGISPTRKSGKSKGHFSCIKWAVRTDALLAQLPRLFRIRDNQYDSAAIKNMMDRLGRAGVVANSTYDVKSGNWSAGRIYDK